MHEKIRRRSGFFAPSATIEHAYNGGGKEVDVFLLVTLEG